MRMSLGSDLGEAGRFRVSLVELEKVKFSYGQFWLS